MELGPLAVCNFLSGVHFCPFYPWGAPHPPPLNQNLDTPLDVATEAFKQLFIIELSRNSCAWFLERWLSLTQD